MSVVAGAGTQRVTGLGFALVSSPLLVLVAGPFNGVLLANVLSLTVNLVVLAMTWREVEVLRAAAAGAGAVPGPGRGLRRPAPAATGVAGADRRPRRDRPGSGAGQRPGSGVPWTRWRGGRRSAQRVHECHRWRGWPSHG